MLDQNNYLLNFVSYWRYDMHTIWFTASQGYYFDSERIIVSIAFFATISPCSLLYYGISLPILLCYTILYDWNELTYFNLNSPGSIVHMTWYSVEYWKGWSIIGKLYATNIVYQTKWYIGR